MDIDNSGLISLRELRRVLTGTTARNTLLVRFEHPDVGIVWNLDQDDCVVIDHIEDKSPASLRTAVINGLMLLRINNCPITPYDRASLEVLHKELIRVHDDYMELEFVEPLVRNHLYHPPTIPPPSPFLTVCWNSLLSPDSPLPSTLKCMV